MGTTVTHDARVVRAVSVHLAEELRERHLARSLRRRRHPDDDVPTDARAPRGGGRRMGTRKLLLRIRVVASSTKRRRESEPASSKNEGKKVAKKKKEKEKETTVYRRSNLADWRGQSDVRKRDEDSQLAVSDDNARRRATIHSSPRGVSSSRR